MKSGNNWQNANRDESRGNRDSFGGSRESGERSGQSRFGGNRGDQQQSGEQSRGGNGEWQSDRGRRDLDDSRDRAGASRDFGDSRQFGNRNDQFFDMDDDRQTLGNGRNEHSRGDSRDEFNSDSGSYGGSRGMNGGNRSGYDSTSGSSRGYGSRDQGSGNRNWSSQGDGWQRDSDNMRGWRNQGSYDTSDVGGYSGGERMTGNSGNQMSHVGKGPKGWQRSDDRIREDVSEALARHAALDASDIEVQVANGEITLTGTVANRADKRTAEETAERVFGVSEVQNQIKLKKEGAMAQSSDKSGDSRMADARTNADTSDGKNKKSAGAGNMGGASSTASS